MPKRWAFSAQREWLAKELPSFTEEQAKGRTERFFGQTMEKWFKDFPEEDVLFPKAPGDQPRGLTDGERLQLSRAKLARRKVVSWYGWYSKRQARLETKPDLGVFKIDGLAGQRERVPQAVEVYQRLFPEKVRAAMAKERKAEGAVLPGERIRVQKKVARAMFEEDKDAHETVAENIARLKEEKKMKKVAEKSFRLEHVERTAAEYHKALKQLPAVLLSGLQAIAESTGWVLCVLAAGPTPSSDGAICMEEYYVGPKSSTGLDFMNAHIDFERNVRIPFGEHVQTCFPIEVRHGRALNRLSKASSEDLEGLMSMSPSRSVTPENQSPDTDEFDSDSDEDKDNDALSQAPEKTGTPATLGPSMDANAFEQPGRIVTSEITSVLTRPPTGSPRKNALDRYRSDRRSVTVSDNDGDEGPWGNQAWLDNPDCLFDLPTPSTPPAGSRISMVDVPGGPTSPIAHAFARMAAYNKENDLPNPEISTEQLGLIAQACVNLDHLDPALRPAIPSLPLADCITGDPSNPIDHSSTATLHAVITPTPDHISKPTGGLSENLNYEVPGAVVNDVLANSHRPVPPPPSKPSRQKPKPRPIFSQTTHGAPAGDGTPVIQITLPLTNPPLTDNAPANDGNTVTPPVLSPVNEVSSLQPQITKRKRSKSKVGDDSILTPAQKRAATIAAKKAAARDSATTQSEEPLEIPTTRNGTGPGQPLLGSALPSVASGRSRRAIKAPVPRDASPTVRKK